MSRSSTIKRGFRRLGIVLAPPCLLSAIVACALAIYQLATLPQARTHASGPDHGIFEFAEAATADEISGNLSQVYGRSLKDWEVVRYSSQMWGRDRAFKAGLWAFGSALLGATLFILSWTIGWVTTGFTSDGTPSKNASEKR